MSIEAQTVEYNYIGDGVSTVFPFPARFLSNADILVGLGAVQQTTGFTISGAGSDSGGNVTFAVAPAVGVRVTLIRAPVANQLIDFVNGQTVFENVLDTGLDKLTMICQYLLRASARSIRLSDFDPYNTPSLVLPTVADRASRLLGFDVNGSPTSVMPNPGGPNGTVVIGGIVDATAAGRALLSSLFIDGYVPTLALFQVNPVHALVDFVQVGGFAAVGDCQTISLKRLPAAPGVVKPWHVQSSDGAWWSYFGPDASPRWFGAVGDGVADDTAAVQAALDYAAAFKTRARIDGVFAVPTTKLLIDNRVVVFGSTTDAEIRRTRDVVTPLLAAVSKTGVVVRDLKLGHTGGWTGTGSNTIGTGSKSFTVPAGLNVIVGDFVEIRSAADPKSSMIGAVTAYSGTSMTINVTITSSSGTTSSWLMDRYDGENTGLSFEGCTSCSAQRVVVAGRWYVGMRSLNGNGDSFDYCETQGVINRSIYAYGISGGSVDGTRIMNNRVRGQGLSQYGISVFGATGAVENVVVSGNIVDGMLFQGIAVGGIASSVAVTGNQVDGVADVSGVGIMALAGNGNQPADILITGNNIKNAAGQGVYVVDAFDVAVVGNQVAACGRGILVAQAGVGLACQGVRVVANDLRNCTTHGIHFTAATASAGGLHTCVGNTVRANTGTGILSDATTDRIAFGTNVSFGNGVQYNLLGTNHAQGATV